MLFTKQMLLTRLTDCWRPDDWFKLDGRVLEHYWQKAVAFADAGGENAKRVIEIGTRCGYSIATFSLVAPAARYLCVDGFLDDDSAACGLQWYANVRYLGIDAELVGVNSHDVNALPPADFAHVDGDHSEDGAYDDLLLVAHIPTILADDCDNPNVRRAVVRFLADRPGHDGAPRRVTWIDDGLRQAALIR